MTTAARHPFLATMELRTLLLGGRRLSEISPLEVEAICERHGLHGATRRALADHLYTDVLRVTLADKPGQALSEAAALALDRLRTLLGAT